MIIVIFKSSLSLEITPLCNEFESNSACDYLREYDKRNCPAVQISLVRNFLQLHNEYFKEVQVSFVCNDSNNKFIWAGPIICQQFWYSFHALNILIIGTASCRNFLLHFIAKTRLISFCNWWFYSKWPRN